MKLSFVRVLSWSSSVGALAPCRSVPVLVKETVLVKSTQESAVRESAIPVDENFT